MIWSCYSFWTAVCYISNDGHGAFWRLCCRQTDKVIVFDDLLAMPFGMSRGTRISQACLGQYGPFDFMRYCSLQTCVDHWSRLTLLSNLRSSCHLNALLTSHYCQDWRWLLRDPVTALGRDYRIRLPKKHVQRRVRWISGLTIWIRQIEPQTHRA